MSKIVETEDIFADTQSRQQSDRPLAARPGGPRAVPSLMHRTFLPRRPTFTNAVYLIALDLGKYECGAICSVADGL
jgi:hypothetical protein